MSNYDGLIRLKSSGDQQWNSMVGLWRWQELNTQFVSKRVNYKFHLIQYKAVIIIMLIMTWSPHLFSNDLWRQNIPIRIFE